MSEENDQNGFTLIAKTLFGLEDILAEELKALGATEIVKLNRAVSFKSDLALMYRANLYLRTAIKVLKPIHHFFARNEDAFYQNIQKIDWSEYFTVDETFAIDSHVKSEYFNHSKYISLKTKDAIVDQFRDKTGSRPSVSVSEPDLRINIHVYNDECTLSLDSSGDSLHKRGYRVGMTQAPLNEVLAAGMILLSGWNRDCDFMDPMCGSGTLLIEAAMYACNIAAGKFRKGFGFMTWNNFDQKLWEEIKQESLDNETDFEYNIIGSDLSEKAVDIATENILSVGLDEYIRISVKSITKRLPLSNKGIIVTNPPYGERLDKENVNAFYKIIGDHLKQNYKGFDAWMISSNTEAFKYVGLQTSKKVALFNGGLECKFHKYSIYEGSRKAKYKK